MIYNPDLKREDNNDEDSKVIIVSGDSKRGDPPNPLELIHELIMKILKPYPNVKWVLCSTGFSYFLQVALRD